ncbi:MAG: TonB family protein [Chitinophagaceae bacterium]|nr:TonB family protein [Chitinophagaceae bacterium]
MRLLFTISLLIAAIQLSGQTIEKYYDYKWNECEADEARFYCQIIKTDSGYVRKDYFIHEKKFQMVGKYKDKETKINDGQFHYFYSNGTVSSTGIFKEGKKEGLWYSFYSNGNIKDSSVYLNGERTGTSLSWHPNGFMKDSIIINNDETGVSVSWFDNGNPSSAGFLRQRTKPHGIWKYFHINGNLSSKEVYENGKLTSKTYYDESGVELKDAKRKDAEASFPGKTDAWLNYLHGNSWFPEQFRFTNNDKAVVVVTFTVNEEGKVEDAFVSTPLYPAFDKIALDAVKNSPKWKPAISHNRAVKAWFSQPVTFVDVNQQ